MDPQGREGVNVAGLFGTPLLVFAGQAAGKFYPGVPEKEMIFHSAAVAKKTYATSGSIGKDSAEIFLTLMTSNWRGVTALNGIFPLHWGVYQGKVLIKVPDLMNFWILPGDVLHQGGLRAHAGNRNITAMVQFHIWSTGEVLSINLREI